MDVELKKTGAVRMPVFSFAKPFLSIMTAKKQQTKKRFLKKFSLEKLSSMSLSSDAFYGTFLSLGLLVTGLLFGASFQVSLMSTPSPEISFGKARLQASVGKLIGGFPMEEMMPYIVKQDNTTAALLVGIAKKESNWGKRVPRLPNGDDCYNYWGYRGVTGSRGTAMGHTCFGSPEEAVTVVSARLDDFATRYQFDTPEELIVWKCGWSCNGHSQKSVNKWIADVGYYSHQIK